jgi:ubiquinol oxidase
MRSTILAILAAALVSLTTAFAPIAKFGTLPTRVPAFANSQRPGLSIRQGVQTAPDRRVRTTMSAAPESSGMAAREMEQGIYNFNKIVIDTVYDIICLLYPVTGGPRDFARFYVLETVARVPYFAYLSVMHLRETFGARESGLGERMRTHYAEADNELHHLLIMEALGGNSSLIDRTVAQTMAFGYYWYVTAVYSVSEQAAYHLSELIEDHAYNTYNTFLTEHEAKLKSMPVPPIARKYYEEDNPFLFDLFCTVKDVGDDGQFSQRRPKLESLYDVFVNVRNDEREHWKTLCNLVQYNDMQGVGNKKVEGTKAKPALAASSTN